MLGRKDITTAFTKEHARITLKSNFIASGSRKAMIYVLDTKDVKISDHERVCVADLETLHRRPGPDDSSKTVKMSSRNVMTGPSISKGFDLCLAHLTVSEN